MEDSQPSYNFVLETCQIPAFGVLPVPRNQLFTFWFVLTTADTSNQFNNAGGLLLRVRRHRGWVCLEVLQSHIALTRCRCEELSMGRRPPRPGRHRGRAHGPYLVCICTRSSAPGGAALGLLLTSQAGIWGVYQEHPGEPLVRRC